MPTHPPEVAMGIYQNLLDRINECYKSGDFGAYLEMVHVPHHIRTSDRSFVLREVNELKTMFDEFIDLRKRLKADTFKRICTTARFKGANQIEGEHVSHLLSGSRYVQPSAHHRAMMMKIGTKWVVCASHSKITEDTPISKALEAASKEHPGRSSQ